MMRAREREENGRRRRSAWHPARKFQVGLWRYLSLNPSYSNDDVCLPYHASVSIDAAFLAAQLASALALCLGCVPVLWTSNVRAGERGEHKRIGREFCDERCGPAPQGGIL